MGYDPFSPLSAACINVLCLPTNRITPERFSKFLKIIKEFSCIRVETDGVAHAEAESAAPPNTEVIFLNFSPHWDSGQLQSSFFFEPNREIQAVVGFLDGSQFENGPNPRTDFNEVVEHITLDFRQHVSQDLATSAIIRFVVFDTETTNGPEGVLCIPIELDKMRKEEAVRFLAQLSRDVRLNLEERIHADAVTTAHVETNPAQGNGIESKQTSSYGGRTSEVLRRSESQSRSTSQDSSVKTREPISQDKSRKLITTGLVHLQTGQWKQAFEPLTQGAVSARESNDHAWQARALEALLTCMLLQFWIGIEFPIPQCCQIPNRVIGGSRSTLSLIEANKLIPDILGIAKSKNSYQTLTTLIPGLVATIIDLYERAEMGIANTLSTLLACQSRIRWTNLLITLKKHGCTLTKAAVTELVRIETNIESSSTTNDSTLTLRSSTLTNMLFESATKAQSHLSVQDAIFVLVAVAYSLSSLGVGRKQAFHLKALLQDLAPRLNEARRVGAAEAGIHPAANNLANQSSLDTKKQDIASGVRDLLYLTLRAYDLPGYHRKSFQDGTLSEAEFFASQRLADWSMAHTSGDVAVKLEALRLCLRVSDAVPDAEGSLYFMCLLFSISRQVITLPPAVSGLLPLISADEQNRILNGIKGIATASTKLDQTNILAEYWDDFLVRDIQISEEPNTGKLMPHSPQDLSITTSTGSEVKKDPFIYNPFSRSKDRNGSSTLVENESVNFNVLLQNPLEVDIEIDDISLVAEGCDFQPSHHSIVLGPFCSQVFTLAGKPKQAGTLKISGCKATIQGCCERNFAIFKDNWQPSSDQKRNISSTRSKLLNESSLNSSKVNAPRAVDLTLNVIEPLPLLQISSCSLVQRSIMLLEGETKLFNITLRNISDLDVDLLLFTYEDSVSKQLREALNNKDLPPHDLHELQYQLATNPAIRRHSQITGRAGKKTAVQIVSHSEASFTFEIFGKPGLVNATILIDYGYLGRPRAELEGIFYTRQLQFTINTTVNGSVDILRCSVMPTQDGASPRELFGALEFSNANQQILSKTMEKNKESKIYCMLQLDLRNIWPQPLNATIEADFRDDEEDASIWEICYSHVLQPGQLERAVVIIPRLYVANALATIPNIDSKRQFVVSTSNMSKEAEAASRESFWYREKLLNRLKMTWKDDKGHRSGSVDLRKGIRLSSRMIDALKIEHVQLSFQVEAASSEDESCVTRVGPSHFTLQRDKFAKLIVKVKNRTNEALRLLLRLQPVLRNQPHTIALDLSKRFAWSGVLQRVLHLPLNPDGEQITELGIVALAVGNYEINATVEELRSLRNSGFANLDSQPYLERQIWHARAPCLIDAIQNTSQMTQDS